jgi:HEAT repeat protein
MKLGAVLVLALLSQAAWAKAVSQKTLPAAPMEPLPVLKQQLMGSDDDKALDAARKLADSGDGKALDALLDALALGAPPKRAADILSALSGKKDARTVDVLKHFARNRNPELRKKALVALGTVPDGRAVGPLMAALSDEVEEVRAAAANALGQRREKGSVERMVLLFKRRDTAAAMALGQLGTPELAHRIAEMLGEVPDAQFCTALGEMLKRPDFGPEPIRVELVKALAKVPGIDSTTVLVEYVAATERDKQRPSRLEAQKIVDQRSSQ